MKRIFLPGFVILMLSAPIIAQNTASLSGRVTDERGAAVVGAEAHLRSRSGAHLLLVTDNNGDYSFKSVVPGDYMLEIIAKGFATFTSTELNLRRGQPLTNDVRLSIQAISENVVVTASGTAQRVDETSKSLSVLDGQSIESRRELMLAESLRGVPGLRVQQQGSLGELTTLRLRGERNFDTAILLDGLRSSGVIGPGRRMTKRGFDSPTFSTLRIVLSSPCRHAPRYAATLPGICGNRPQCWAGYAACIRQPWGIRVAEPIRAHATLLPDISHSATDHLVGLQTVRGVLCQVLLSYHLLYWTTRLYQGQTKSLCQSIASTSTSTCLPCAMPSWHRQ